MFFDSAKGGGTVNVLDLGKEGEATVLLLEFDDRIGAALSRGERLSSDKVGLKPSRFGESRERVLEDFHLAVRNGIRGGRGVHMNMSFIYIARSCFMNNA